YRNNHDGTFTDVTEKAGLVASGWGQGVCIGDYDNDGWDDLYVTYYGKNRLYHNRHGTFEEVADTAGVAGDGKTWGSGCAFVDYDRDGQRSEEHTSELQSHLNLVCRLLLEKKKDNKHLLACRTEPH